MSQPPRTSRFPGLYRLPVSERRDALGIAADDARLLDTGGLDGDGADAMVENAVGIYALPLAVAANFTIDGIDALIPMAIEEASVVAAASHAAKLVRAGGGFVTSASPPAMIGQIHLYGLADVAAATAALRAASPALVAEARALVPRLVGRGGGPTAVEVRPLDDHGPDGGMLVVHLIVDTRDAMGANIVNGLCEDLADRVAAIAGGTVGLRILSNLADQRTVAVRCHVPDAVLGDDGDGPMVAAAIARASRFAEVDPYRAATHNKGIMNGVDAVLVATGQDWRAAEAGAHAFAAAGGRYRPLATWRLADAGLVGEMTLPLALGTAGGALWGHAGARWALRLSGATSSQRLAALAAAAGLATNLAALRALATDGIQRGHMALHAKVVARAAGATGPWVERVADEISRLGDVRTERAREVLSQLVPSEDS